MRKLMILLPLLMMALGVSAQEDFDGLRRKAEAGDAESQYVLGNCYISGEGVAQDKKEAVKWLRSAYDKGNMDAKELLEELEQ